MKMFFVGIVFCLLFFLSGSSHARAEEKKAVEFVFEDYALSVKYTTTETRDNWDIIHYRNCTDIILIYSTALGTAESAEIKEVEVGKEKITILFAKFKLPNGTITFCEWPLSKFIDPNAKKNKTKEGVRLYFDDPPRRISLVPKGKPR
ncbi:MAG: hypothetical protein RJA61_86 [Candidatus Parcubacteria bacterium]|jgi:hypothetical protein